MRIFHLNLAKINQMNLYTVELYKNSEGVVYLDYLSYFIKPQLTVPNGKIREETFQRKY
jgi:hypothetical protein